MSLQNRGTSGAGNAGSYATGPRPCAVEADGAELTLHPSDDVMRAAYAMYVATDYPDDPPLAPGISEADRDRYTSRHCHQLAWSLHEATGWPYAAVCDGYAQETDTFGWMHMGVMAPSGQVLDVEGLQDIDDVLEAYGDLSEAEDGDSWLEVTDRMEKFTVVIANEMPPDDVIEATRVAGALLAAYRDTASIVPDQPRTRWDGPDLS